MAFICRGSSSMLMKAFRSDYFKIAELRSILSDDEKVSVVVLTATATPDVDKQIRENLQMTIVTRLASPPDRPNIRYAAARMKIDAEDRHFSWLVEELLKQGYHARSKSFIRNNSIWYGHRLQRTKSSHSLWPS